MTPLYAIFDATHLGASLELEQSGTQLAVNAVADINRTALALFPQSVGRWYAELLVYGPGTLLASVGVATTAASLATYAGGDANGYGYRLDLGEIHHAGAAIDGSPGAPVAAKGDIIGVLLDLTTTQPTVTWYRNGVLVYSANLPSTGPWALAASLGGSEAYGLRCFLNAGQRAFEYAPPGVDGWYQPQAVVRGLRLGSEDWLSAPTDVVPHQRYSGLLAGDNSELRAVRSLDFWPWQRGVQTGAMVLTAYDADNVFAEILAGDARDLPVAIGSIDAGQTYADRVSLFSAVIDSVSAVDDLTVKLTCRDPLGLLAVPLQRALIRPDAEPAAANTPRPIVLGACRNVPAVLTDAVNLVYAVSDAPVLGIGYVRDSGYPLDPAAAPADFKLDAQKTSLLLNASPVGKVTADLSSVGGDQLPQPSDDILGGAGDPLTGSDGSSPTGMPAADGDTIGSTPTMQGGVLQFPVIANSSTIRVSGDIATSAYSGPFTPGPAGTRTCVRISWRNASGGEIGYNEGTALYGTNATATYTAEATAPDGASFGVMEFAAYAHSGGTATYSNAKAWYVLPSGLVAIPIKNPTFTDASGWNAEISPMGQLFEFFPGYVVKHPDTSGNMAPSISRALRNQYLANDVPSTQALGWLPLTSVTKFGAGKSFQVKVTIPTLPEGIVAIGLATGTTIDTIILKWTKAGTYTATITNSDGVDHDLYLLGVPLVPGAIATPPTVSTIQLITYDDSYNPEPISLVPATLQAIKLADYLHQILDVRAADVGAAWSLADAQAIDTATGYAGIGVYLGGGETIAQTLDMALASYTACKWCDGAGTIRITRMIAPESVAEVDRAGTIDINALDGDLVPMMDVAPGLTTQMGVRRNCALPSDGDLVAASVNFPLSVRQSMLRTFQQTASSAQPLAGAYRHALYAAPVASCFDQQADGQAEIDRICGIYAQPRWFYAGPVFLDALPGLDLGQVWTLVYPKYGLASGKPVMIIDYQPDLLAGTANIICWG